MLFKAFLPKSLSTANIAEVALSTSISVNHTRHKRFWEFILEGKAGGQSSRSFVYNFNVTEWDDLSKCTHQVIFRFPGRCSKKWEYHYHFPFGNSVDRNFFLALFIKEIENTRINQF